MSYNDPMGEWIRPKHPDIFEKERPPHLPPGPERPLKRTNSCPDAPTPYVYEECKLADQKGFVLWDGLFKLMSKQISLVLPAMSTKRIVDEKINQLSKFNLQKAPQRKKGLRRSHSVDEITRFYVCDSLDFFDEKPVSSWISTKVRLVTKKRSGTAQARLSNEKGDLLKMNLNEKMPERQKR